MALITLPLHHLMSYKYQNFVGGTDFVATDTINVLGTLGRASKKVTITTVAGDAIEVKFNTLTKSYPNRDMETSIDNMEHADLADARSHTLTEQNSIIMGASETRTFDFPITDIEIVSLTAVPEILVY